MNLDVSILYVAILGLLHVPFTFFVGMYRFRSRISLLDGGDKVLRNRMRAHANFTENVPIALILLLSMDALGASASWLHSVGAVLVVSRVVHYSVIATNPGNTPPRFLAMIGTLGAIFASSLWLLSYTFTH